MPDTYDCISHDDCIDELFKVASALHYLEDTIGANADSCEAPSPNGAAYIAHLLASRISTIASSLWDATPVPSNRHSAQIDGKDTPSRPRRTRRTTAPFPPRRVQPLIRKKASSRIIFC